MKTIACNTLNGAVSEYTRHGFQSITATHAGSAAGLCVFGGDSDNGLPIVSDVQTPSSLRDSSLKKYLSVVYVSMRGEGQAQLSVFGPHPVQWDYRFDLRSSGQTRCVVGRGIRENYLGFGLATPQGQAFTLDRVEVLLLESKNRRV